MGVGVGWGLTFSVKHRLCIQPPPWDFSASGTFTVCFGSACFFFSIGLAVALAEQILRESDVWENTSIHLHLSRSERWTSVLSYGINAPLLQQRANGCP